MENIFSSLIGALLLFVFLGWYAVGVRSIVFALIVVGVLVLVGFDFYETVKKGNGGTGT